MVSQQCNRRGFPSLSCQRGVKGTYLSTLWVQSNCLTHPNRIELSDLAVDSGNPNIYGPLEDVRSILQSVGYNTSETKTNDGLVTVVLVSRWICGILCVQPTDIARETL